MAIISKQIGWSQESQLLWLIAKELDMINQRLKCCAAVTTTTTTTVI